MKASFIAGFFLMLVPGILLANQLDITQGDAGKDLVLCRGDELKVTLPANPTTGYSWSVLCSSPGLLQQWGESRFEQSRHRPGMVGVGGEQIWKFRALASGMMILRFSYARSWERGVDPVRMIEWPVTIRK